MKKILFISAAIIVLLLIAGYAYLQFRKYSSYKVHIHKDAALLLKVNVDGLLFEMGYKTKQDKGNVPRGVSLPANIFIYNLHGKSPSAFFCTLPVTDTSELRNYLIKVLKVKVLQRYADGTVSGQSRDGRLNVLYNTENIAFSYSVLKEKIAVTLNDILTGKDILSDKDPKIHQLKNNAAHLAYIYEKYQGEGNIKNNLLMMTGTFPIGNLGVPDKSVKNAEVIKDPVLKMWLNADLKKLLHHQKLKLHNMILPLDSIADYYAGYAALELGNYSVQENQEVTYEYNDDFERVEKVKINQVKVPEFMALFLGKANSLSNYLQKNKVIENDVISKELFPLYELYKRNDEETLVFSTSKTVGRMPSTLSTPHFFSASIDFTQIRKFNQFSILSSYIKPFSYLKANAKKQNAETGQFELEFKLN